MMTELKNALVHGLDIVVALSYVYAGILIVAPLVKWLWRK